MSINPFHYENLLKSAGNYPIAKGDLPGHPFRGNQYQTLNSALDHISQTAYRSGGRIERDSVADAHRAAAKEHYSRAAGLLQHAQNQVDAGLSNTTEQYKQDVHDAIGAHLLAGKAHDAAADENSRGVAYGPGEVKPYNAEQSASASKTALRRSGEARATTELLS